MLLRHIFAAAGLLSMPLLSFAKPLAVGAVAPTLTGITETGASLNLADVYARQPYTLVYFYPKADTPGCTAQGCSLRDAHAELVQKGVAVVGVSTDLPEAQRAFKDKHQLPFPLIADHDQKFITAFGVPTLLGFAKRQAFLIKDGRIVWADYSAATKQQAEDVLKFVAAAAKP